ncbi:MAG TPA: hypothetical protein VLD58_12245 [Gemmatimonadales bacterium]|nr:hypothetical protein [Gemmatimonadales bacterium]
MNRAAQGLIFAGLAVGMAASLQAQDAAPRTHAVELTLAAGFFQPTGTSGTTGGSTPILLTRRPAPAGSLHLSFNPPSGVFAVDFSGGYAPEGLRQQAAGAAGKSHTNLSFASAKLMIGRSPRKPGVSYLIGAGFGIEHRKKSVLDPAVSATNAGPAVSAMIRIPIDGQVGLRLDAEDLIYQADWGYGKKTRNDFILSAGLSIAW